MAPLIQEIPRIVDELLPSLERHLQRGPRRQAECSMEEEGERRRDLCERALAWLADLIELRPYARQNVRRPRDVGAQFVHVGFACPFDLGRVR
jgi:hypothetical protein